MFGKGKKERRYLGLNRDEMRMVLHTMCRIEDENYYTPEEENAFDIAIQCVTTVMNRMADDRRITWDD